MTDTIRAESLPAGAQSVLDQAQPVLDAFFTAVEACGRVPPFKPHIEIAAKPGPIRYDHDKRAVVLVPYELLAPPHKAAMDRFAAIGTLGLSGRQQYGEVFNNLLVAHELGHWLQCVAYLPITRWQAEYDANRIMVAFWRDHPDHAHPASTDLRLANFVAQPPSMPDPMVSAPGTNPADYFNANLADIEANPSVYAAFQKFMVRQAISERPAPTFYEVVSTTWPI